MSLGVGKDKQVNKWNVYHWGGTAYQENWWMFLVHTSQWHKYKSCLFDNFFSLDPMVLLNCSALTQPSTLCWTTYRCVLFIHFGYIGTMIYLVKITIFVFCDWNKFSLGSISSIYSLYNQFTCIPSLTIQTCLCSCLSVQSYVSMMFTLSYLNIIGVWMWRPNVKSKNHSGIFLCLQNLLFRGGGIICKKEGFVKGRG